MRSLFNNWAGSPPQSLRQANREAKETQGIPRNPILEVAEVGKREKNEKRQHKPNVSKQNYGPHWKACKLSWIPLKPKLIVIKVRLWAKGSKRNMSVLGLTSDSTPKELLVQHMHGKIARKFNKGRDCRHCNYCGVDNHFSRDRLKRTENYQGNERGLRRGDKAQGVCLIRRPIVPIVKEWNFFPFMSCSSCLTVKYCSKNCQLQHIVLLEKHNMNF